MHARQRTHAARSDHDDADPTHATPGKASLAEQLPPDPRAALLAVVRRGGGGALPDPLRGQLERALGASLGDVRVHTSGDAANAAAGLDARACAVGQDIVFGAGQYDPGNPGLIAHEVAHTVQQRGASVGGDLAVSSPGDAHEHEADRFAGAFTSGGTAPVSVRPGSIARAVIARQATGEAAPPAPMDQALRARLGDEASEACDRLDGEYLLLKSRLRAAYVPYQLAYTAYLATLRAQRVREQVAANIALDILFVGLGGLAGGALSAALRTGLGAGGSTAVGDIIKYTIRLAPQAILSQLSTAPVPSGEPLLWLEGALGVLDAQRGNLRLALADLRHAIRTSTTPPPQSPLDVLAPFIAEAQQLARTPRNQQYYAFQLWRPWLEHFLDRTRGSDEILRDLVAYRSMNLEIDAQCGPEARILRERVVARQRERIESQALGIRPDPYEPLGPPDPLTGAQRIPNGWEVPLPPRPQ